MIYCSLPDMPASCTTDLLVCLNISLSLSLSLSNSFSLSRFFITWRVSSTTQKNVFFFNFASGMLFLLLYLGIVIPIAYYIEPGLLIEPIDFIPEKTLHGLGGSHRWHALNNSLANIPDSLLSLLCLSEITAFIIVYFIACLPGTLFNIMCIV